MQIEYVTWSNDNDVDIKFVPQNTQDKALLRALSARNPKIQLIRKLDDLSIRFVGAARNA